MSYSPSLFTGLTEQLRQPTWWAAIASVGIHGILGVSAPVLSIFSPQPKSAGKVEVLELTPEEMKRLPQTLPSPISPPQFSISPIPAPPNLIPPLPPEPSSILLPSLPPGMPSFVTPTAPLPPLNSPPPSNQTAFAPTPNFPSFINPPSLRSQPNPVIPPPPLQGFPLPEPNPGRTDPQMESDLERLGNTDNRRPQFDPPRIYTPEDFPQGGNASNPNKTAANPDPTKVPPTVETPGTNPGATTPSPTVEDPTKRNRLAESPLVTAMRQKMEAERQARQTPNASPQGGSTSATDEKNIAFVNTYNSLLIRFQQAYPNLEPTRYVSVPVAYPREACSQKLEDRVIYGVVVKPEGAIAAVPELLATQGYSILNLAARNAATTYKFPASSNPKLYPLVFDFKYDEKICGSLPVGPSPSPQPQPSTQPSPTGSPQPQPSTQPSPTGSPQPQPSTQPSPTGSPQPQPSTQPSPTGSPQPQPSTQPSPTGSPQPQPSTQPLSEPSPTSTPEPSTPLSPESSPQPEPSVSPSSEPSPTSAPEPSVSPSSEPSPTSAPEPSVSPSSEPSPTSN
ncbi:energy transducer TonB [Phormidium nigroviride]